MIMILRWRRTRRRRRRRRRFDKFFIEGRRGGRNGVSSISYNALYNIYIEKNKYLYLNYSIPLSLNPHFRLTMRRVSRDTLAPENNALRQPLNRNDAQGSRVAEAREG